MDEKLKEYVQRKARFEKALSKLNIDANSMSYQSRYELTQALGVIMSESSERFICAGWNGDWAYTIKEAFESGDTTFLDPHLVTVMRVLYEMLGHWADHDEDAHYWSYIPYVP